MENSPNSAHSSASGSGAVASANATPSGSSSAGVGDGHVQSHTDAGSSLSATNILEFQKSVNKRLNAMTDRQDSIQALSLWMIHHKTDCQKITACWLAAMKRAKVSRRLLLFYLANDVVQSCKKKNAKIYLLAFKNVLKDAVVLVRDGSIKHKIERIFHIWEERKTYINAFVDELRELLNDREKVTAHVSASNFKPKDVIESIRKVHMLETHVMMKQKQVQNLKLDASKIEAVKQLKDRSHSHEFAKQFDDSYNKMQSYVKMLENEIEQRTKLIKLLENGQTFYEVQNDDAMVVANAYRNFGIRINNLKKRLIDYKDTLSDGGDSPMPSPSAEAPSPGNTPPQDTTDAEEMDMELSDAEENEPGKIIAAEPYTPTSSNSLTDRLAAMGNALPGVTADPRHNKEAAANVGGYNPAEQLQREKVAGHNFLFSMVAAKAQPTTQRAADRSVLKNLTEFAEKVKNPPPKDWSEFNKKQMEKAKALAAEQKALAEQIEQKKLALEQQEQLSLQQKQELVQEPPVPPPQLEQPAYTDTPVTPLIPSTEQSSHVTQTQTYNQSESNIADQGECDEMQSMSWPPQNTDTTGTEATCNPPPPLPPTNVRVAAPRLDSPIRPPSFIRPPLAPHIQIHDPASAEVPARPTNNVLTVSKPPPPPPPPPAAANRSLSSEQQQDALDLLDSIHAEVKESTPDHITIVSQASHITVAPANSHGIPISTLSSSTISPIMNRQNPAPAMVRPSPPPINRPNLAMRMTRPPVPPNYGNYGHFQRPPLKRPYQDYGNYPYY